MSSESPFWLHSVSVVVTAEFHNPSILNQDFLVAEGIVPKDWEVVETITTPPLSIVRFSNNIQWTVIQESLIVAEECESTFRDGYRVHNLARVYLEKLPHVPYRSLGLNCVVSIAYDNPQQWLIERFLNPEVRFESEPLVLSMLPKFTFDVGDALLYLTMNEKSLRRGKDSPENAVVIDCNVHHEGPLNSAELREAIERWPACQDTILTVLQRLIGDS